MKKTRDRVKELIRVKASELRANGMNWRAHGDQQKAAMRGILDEVGFVSGLIAFRDKRGKLALIDGHLRKEISGDELVPVQVVDLTEAEVKKILATFDPIGAMATSNAEALETLVSGMKIDSEGVAAMLAELMGDREIEQEIEETLLDQAVQLRPEREYIVVMCDSDAGEQWEELREVLGLKLVRRGGYKKGSQFDATGIERVIPASRIIEAIRGQNVGRNSVDGTSGKRSKSGAAAGGDGVRPGRGAKRLSGGGSGGSRRGAKKSPGNHADA